jgi:hypothetical protein
MRVIQVLTLTCLAMLLGVESVGGRGGGGGVGKRRRHPRFVEDMAQASPRAACPYTFTWDRNPERIPEKIPKVVCKRPPQLERSAVGPRKRRPPGSCFFDSKQKGCCTTLKLTMDVRYFRSNRTIQETFPMACVCLKTNSRRIQQNRPQKVD